MRPRNATNINSELNAIKRQIDFFEGIEYSEELNHFCGSCPYPLSGLDESDFHIVKREILRLIKECYNKKNDEMIKFCQNNKI